MCVINFFDSWTQLKIHILLDLKLSLLDLFFVDFFVFIVDFETVMGRKIPYRYDQIRGRSAGTRGQPHKVVCSISGALLR